MLVAMLARDKPDSLQTRLDNREAHIEHLERSEIVSQAGPLLDDDGNMIGSLIVFDVEDMQQARDWVADDPYTQADLFETTDMIIWKKVI
ncbi:MAG: YciI family protein [Pseudomonadota bacterium]